jgi:cell division topological specificity factor
MTFFNLFQRRASAPVARERLQILLSHERSGHGKNDLLGVLREEILAAMAKHILVELDNVKVRMDRGDTLSTLEIAVEIQHQTGSLPCPSPTGRARAPRDRRGAGARERMFELELAVEAAHTRVGT